MGPDLIVEAVTTRSISDFKYKVLKAIKKQKEENNQLAELQ